MSVAKNNAVAAGEADSALSDPMKAIVQDRFGPPDTLQLVDAEKPQIDAGEVLLKVHAAAVNPWTGTWSAVTRASPASSAVSA